MKTLVVLAALAVAGSGYAATYEKNNQMGGQIVLTDRPSKTCTVAPMTAYATSRDGTVLFGCWGARDGRIWVYIEDQVTVHDPKSFVKKNNEDVEKSTGM